MEIPRRFAMRKVHAHVESAINKVRTVAKLSLIIAQTMVTSCHTTAFSTIVSFEVLSAIDGSYFNILSFPDYST